MAVDATCCRMVGLGVDQVSYFNTARERGLGNFKEDGIEIRGKSIKDVFQQIWLPYLEGFDHWPECNFYTENAGSSCLGLIACTTERMKARGTYDKNAGISIVVGKKKELPKGVSKEKMILFGDCVKKYAKDGIYVHGCPPGESAPYDSIMERMDSEEIRAKRVAGGQPQMYRTRQQSEEE